MRILYICSNWCAGQSFGGELRASQIGKALSQIGNVTVAMVGSEANNDESRKQTENKFQVLLAIQPEERRNSRCIEKLRWAFDARFLNVHGYQAPASAREALLAKRSGFDVTWVLNSRTPNILNEWYWPNSHLDLDDIPSTYFRENQGSGWFDHRRWKERLFWRFMRRRELYWKKRFTTLSVCSAEDCEYLGGGDRIHVIPNGFEICATQARTPSVEKPRLGFIGLCDYGSNRDGIQWFFQKCWPHIRREVPGVEFRLVGSGSVELANTIAASNVVPLGWIDDVAEEIATWSAMVIPILGGGGTRVKLADAFSRKCPVVSTRVGAFGYEVQDKQELLVADKPLDFSQACITLLRDISRAAALADRAHALFLQKWSWDAIAPKVWAAVEDCIRRGRV